MAVAANTHFPVAADVEIKFVRAPTKILQDPQECPVTVIGQLSNLQKIKFEDVGTRLAGSVDSTVWLNHYWYLVKKIFIHSNQWNTITVTQDWKKSVIWFMFEVEGGLQLDK